MQRWKGYHTGEIILNEKNPRVSSERSRANNKLIFHTSVLTMAFQ
jgi:hypothetical protein